MSKRTFEKHRNESYPLTLCPECFRKAHSFQECGQFRAATCHQCERVYHGCCLRAGVGEMAFLCLVTGVPWTCERCQNHLISRVRVPSTDSTGRPAAGSRNEKDWRALIRSSALKRKTQTNAGDCDNRCSGKGIKDDDDDDEEEEVVSRDGTPHSGGNVSTGKDESALSGGIPEIDRERCLVVTMIRPHKRLTDMQLFLDLCSEHFNFVPRVRSVRRMGITKFRENRHRPLEVILESVDEAKKIISMSNKLKTSLDSYTRKHVYINEYLAPTELQKGLKERKERRNKLDGKISSKDEDPTAGDEGERLPEDDDASLVTSATSCTGDTNEVTPMQIDPKEKNGAGSNLTLAGIEPKLDVDLITFPSFP